jgi:rubrerythrin
MTGGAGARVEEVTGIEKPYYHWIKLYYDGEGKLRHERKELLPLGNGENAERFTSPMKDMINESFVNECTAHVKYRIWAETAKNRGLVNLALLFGAAADAEFHHARNFYFLQKSPESPEEALAESIKNERYEAEKFYKDKADYAKDSGLGLPFYAFSDTRKTEVIHLGLFEKALDLVKEGRDIEEKRYYTCTSCGNTFWGEHPANCPICGAPADKIAVCPLDSSLLP